MHRVTPIAMNWVAQADADGIAEFYAVTGMTILAASLCAESLDGGANTCNVDIQDDGTDVITALTANTAGTPGTWLTPAFGGTQTPVHIAAGSSVEVDLNLNAGTADFLLVLFVTLDEV